MFFRKLFSRPKKETPEEMLRRVHPELFDESGKTYNCGKFADTADAHPLTKDEIELFPDIADVFNHVTAFEEKFFLPLCSIDLTTANKTWTGKAHFVYFHKTQDDKVDVKSLINEYGDYNVTLFKCHGERISFMGSQEAFQLTAEELEYWEEAREDYQKNKLLAQTNVDEFLASRRIRINNIVRQVSSVPMWTQSDETPKPVNGEEIFFVGQMKVHALIGEDGYIFLFYIPQNQIFIQVEQWT